MSETDLGALVNEARSLRPRLAEAYGREANRGPGTDEVLSLADRLADALEASIERERKLRKAVQEVVRQKDRMFGYHNVSSVSLFDAVDAARQALEDKAIETDRSL